MVRPSELESPTFGPGDKEWWCVHQLRKYKEFKRKNGASE